jgi:lysophospholipase L1-like esterase
MRLVHISETWRGFGKSLAVAMVVCGAFVIGGAWYQFRHPPRTIDVRKDLLYRDFGELAKYRAEDVALPPNPRRVIFLGDSITSNWDIKTSFPGEPYVNRGIGGQTTSQMLVRFRQDVINLQPASVVILAGANDLGDTSAAPASVPDIENNLQTMAELAAMHHIRPIFASLLPVHDYTPGIPSMQQRSSQIRLVINRWLRSYCAANGYVYIDYHVALVSPNGKMRKELSVDGIHPNTTGYQIMAAIARDALGSKTEEPVHVSAK